MESKLLNCSKCGRLFESKDGSSLCSRCNENVDDDFSKVKDYIYDHPTCSLKDVSDDTGVPTDSILKWIREGRILLSQDSAIRFCQKCGAAIISGKYCPKCIAKLQETLKIDQPEETEYRGMHIKSGEKK